MNNRQPNAEPTPFHSGELALQERLGVRERMAPFAAKVIRDHLPDQHRQFYSELPMLVLGHTDAAGRPWCSLAVGEPGFISSPDNHRIEIKGGFLRGDPIVDHLGTGSRLGILGIEFQSRRRNRVNVTVDQFLDDRLSLKVDQSFGNCPQYIQTRNFAFEQSQTTTSGSTRYFDHYEPDIKRMIDQADTFFVSSRSAMDNDAQSEGVDASHRGGRPGFVRVDDEATLTIPDFLGNFHFNTLGNFLVDPRAGLLFTDFETGDIVMMTGSAEILWDEPAAAEFEGAQRLWRFRLETGFVLKSASPLRWTFGDYSPNSLLTDTWAESNARKEAEGERNSWREYRLVSMKDESDSIRSFNLEPAGGGPTPGFEAGQFLTLRLDPATGNPPLVRTYTVSSAPGESHYRISVKREPAPSRDLPSGAASSYLHDQLQVGDLIEVRAPQGNFSIDPDEERPAVLISAGVGITPMISMLRHTVREGVRTRRYRPMTFIHGARNKADRALFSEAASLATETRGAIRAISVLSQPEPGAEAGRDYQYAGRISAELLQAELPLADYDFYLCGPGPFMQDMYDTLRALGAADKRIFAEAFGPASLERQANEESTAATKQLEAESALVSFSASEFDMPWTPQDGSLLELAEAHGLAPEFGCRNGVCGTCSTRIIEGDVAYRTPPRAEIAPGEALICCAVPAAAESIPVKIKLDL